MPIYRENEKKKKKLNVINTEKETICPEQKDMYSR